MPHTRWWARNKGYLLPEKKLLFIAKKPSKLMVYIIYGQVRRDPVESVDVSTWPCVKTGHPLCSHLQNPNNPFIGIFTYPILVIQILGNLTHWHNCLFVIVGYYPTITHFQLIKHHWPSITIIDSKLSLAFLSVHYSDRICQHCCRNLIWSLILPIHSTVSL